MNIFASSSFAVGLLAGLIIVVILFRFANRDHKLKTEYDERQKEIRGRGYMFGFYAFCICELIMMLLEAGEIELPIPGIMVHLCTILISAMVLGCYTVWKGAYWGLNNNTNRYAVVFIITAALNIIPIIGAVRSGTLVENGKVGAAFANVIVLIMLLILGIELLVKSFVDAREEAEE